MAKVIQMGMCKVRRKAFYEHRDDLFHVIETATERAVEENDEKSLRLLHDLTSLVVRYAEE
jgi:hypothetical protein